MKMQNLPLTDGPVTLDGAISLQITGDGVQPWRIVHDRIDLFEPALLVRAVAPAGVRVTVISDTDTMEVQADSPDCVEGLDAVDWTFDLLVDGQLHQRITQPRAHGISQFTDIPGGEHRLEVWLDVASPVRVGRISIDDGASAKRFDDPRPKWIAYGSSITHCRGAHGPCETWPALVANRFDLNLTSLGYGGNCHMEPIIAKIIRDRPADYISMCLGINVMGSGSLNERTFRAAVIGMIDAAREGHPDVPMAIVSPICNPPREATPNMVDMTLVRMREYIKNAVDTFRAYGDDNVHYIDGLDLFGPDFVKHMPDELHPDADGMHVLARRYGDIVMPKLGLDCGLQI